MITIFDSVGRPSFPESLVTSTYELVVIAILFLACIIILTHINVLSSKHIDAIQTTIHNYPLSFILSLVYPCQLIMNSLDICILCHEFFCQILVHIHQSGYGGVIYYFIRYNISSESNASVMKFLQISATVLASHCICSAAASSMWGIPVNTFV